MVRITCTRVLHCDINFVGTFLRFHFATRTSFVHSLVHSFHQMQTYDFYSNGNNKIVIIFALLFSPFGGYMSVCRQQHHQLQHKPLFLFPFYDNYYGKWKAELFNVGPVAQFSIAFSTFRHFHQVKFSLLFSFCRRLTM